MTLSRWISLSIVSVFAVACDSATSPLTDFEFAAVHGQCGPADGPAVAIFLAPEALDPRSPEPPYVRIYIDRHVTELTERPWVVAGSGVNAGAWYHHGIEREDATAGVVNVTSVAADNTIEGSVHLTFPSGGVQQTFRAGWTPMSGLCP